MKPNLLSVLLLLSLNGSFIYSQDTNRFFVFNPASIERIDTFITGLAEEHHFSGVILVAVNNSICLRKGYGYANREHRIRCSPDQVFSIGSVTKQFTGAAILKLQMMGKLDVMNPITKYFTGVPDDKRGITLHQLLTHSAGFPGAIGDDIEPLSRDSFVERALNTPLEFKPGTAYNYSNVGYSLLAAIIEKVSGLSYEQFLNNWFFKPAGMQKTGYILPSWKPEEFASGYRYELYWGRLADKNWSSDGPYWNLKGNGGIQSTVNDLYAWHNALLGNSLLSDDMKKLYYGRHIREGADAQSFYGYGWAIFPTKRQTWLLAHNGGNGIFFCDFLRFLDEKVTIILLSNAARPAFENLAFEVARTIFTRDINLNWN